MMIKVYQRIKADLTKLLNSEQNQWLNIGLDKLSASKDLSNDLLMLSATTRRNLGQAFLDPELEPICYPSEIVFSFHSWTYADAGRALFIMQAVMISGKAGQRMITDYFQQGDESEIAVITRLAALFDYAEELKPLMREVGRTNSMSLYAALAQYNPYPAIYYTEHEFNQLVLKALFMGISIDPVNNLNKRANIELSKMCEEYIKERVAATRSIPVDIWEAVGPYASAEGELLMIQHLNNEAPEHRYFVVKALQQNISLSTETQQILDEHRLVEKDPRVLSLYNNKR